MDVLGTYKIKIGALQKIKWLIVRDNKIWRIIYRLVRDIRTTYELRRKFNKELQEELGLGPVTSYINGQVWTVWLFHEKRKPSEHL